MANSILDKTYTVNESGGLVANRVVVQDSTVRQCAYPAGAADNSGTILGVTLDDTDDGNAVAVRKLGIALVEAASAISAGDMLDVADTSGRVKTANISAASTTNVVGYAETSAVNAGDLVEVFLALHLACEPV